MHKSNFGTRQFMLASWNFWHRLLWYRNSFSAFLYILPPIWEMMHLRCHFPRSKTRLHRLSQTESSQCNFACICTRPGQLYPWSAEDLMFFWSIFCALILPNLKKIFLRQSCRAWEGLQLGRRKFKDRNVILNAIHSNIARVERLLIEGRNSIENHWRILTTYSQANFHSLEMWTSIFIGHCSMLFNYKTPIPYTIAMASEALVIFHNLRLTSSIANFGVGSYLFALASTKYIKFILNQIIEKRKDQPRTMKFSCDFIDVESRTKQLSATLWRTRLLPNSNVTIEINAYILD